jgi:hypothetical protein
MPVRRLTPAVVLLALLGCKPDDVGPPLYPLTGTLTRDGRPVTEGGLIFIPETGGWGGNVVDAPVRPDGTFAAQTSRTTGAGTVIKPGALAGTYKVVYHPPSDGQKMGLETELPERVTVEVKANAVTLTLPSKLPEGHGVPRDDAPATPVEPKR